MAINEWWAADPEQRYWMEISYREDLGADLRSPKTHWGHELTTYVQPGDVVFHWHASLLDDKGIVGWSQAVGGYEDMPISWQSSSPEPGWRVPLENYIALRAPVLLEDLRSQEGQIRQVQQDLEASYPGQTLYFPFQFSNKRALRASQTYFVKFPKELVDLLGLPTAPSPAPPATSAGSSTSKQAPKRQSSGFMADAAVRSAVEWHAVAIATAHYEGKGFTVVYTGANQPYDLTASMGSVSRRVEVKGSTGTVATVQLTDGEVRNSQCYAPTDLIVVDEIDWTRAADGSVTASGGRTRIWPDWQADPAALKPISHVYTLP